MGKGIAAVYIDRRRCGGFFGRLLERSLRCDAGETFAYVLSGFGARVMGLVATIQSLTTERVSSRLARFLLGQASDAVAMTHHDIAEEIGTAREVVSRQLKRFEQDGWVSLGRHEVHLLAPEALRSLVEKGLE